MERSMLRLRRVDKAVEPATAPVGLVRERDITPEQRWLGVSTSLFLKKKAMLTLDTHILILVTRILIESRPTTSVRGCLRETVDAGRIAAGAVAHIEFAIIYGNKLCARMVNLIPSSSGYIKNSSQSHIQGSGRTDSNSIKRVRRRPNPGEVHDLNDPPPSTSFTLVRHELRIQIYKLRKQSRRAMPWPTWLRNINGLAQPMGYHIHTEYRRKAAASAIAFRLVSESAGGSFLSPLLRFSSDTYPITTQESNNELRCQTRMCSFAVAIQPFMDSCLYDLKDGELSVKCLLYVDDQVILGPSACELQGMVNKINDSDKKRDPCLICICYWGQARTALVVLYERGALKYKYTRYIIAARPQSFTVSAKEAVDATDAH
ncbi:hypothetical protein EVAR_66774_1 [Eumeta japonica]|uniref:Reverse transcriptase domain-containing protein n=1 Tax=Eumeta variegata TaxID=151549 RepID=A0A4C1ZV37_EUMVA|nr:hypothetical protein EVAR_66774_1 [Eumeta japonica]